MGLQFEGYTYGRALGRKRVVISNNGDSSSIESCATRTPLKRLCSGTFISSNSEMSRLETLPQDLLIRVLCGVDHDDLEQLLGVSKTIKEATQIAKVTHFVFNTPKKQVSGVHDATETVDGNEIEEIEAPNAPIRKHKSRLNGRKFAGTVLFADDDDE